VEGFVDCRPNSVEFGELLRRHRAAAFLTQTALAARSGLSVQAISMLERGVRLSPRPATVKLLSQALRLDPAESQAFLAAGGGGRDGNQETTPATTRTLPRDLPAFTGRIEELRRVAETAGSGGSLGISAIDGMPGVGKTAFAVHAAHLLAPLFPDGQLFLDLRGHAAGRPPLSSADALGRLLLTTGTAAQRIPGDLDARAALWRDRVADRRLLLLLDDADALDQVQPLIPAGPRCMVLITSRHRLAALAGVDTLTLDCLPPKDAVELFRRLSGMRHGEEEVVAEVVDRAGGLPLAIQLLAGRLRSHPSWRTRHLAERLRDGRHRLVDVEAEQGAVQTAFALSLQQLPAERRRLFSHIGLHPGRELDAHAAAAMEGVDVVRAENEMEGIYDAHLVDEPQPGRYRMHDLIRAYASSLAMQHEGPEGAVALRRLLDYYLAAAMAANERIALQSDAGTPVALHRVELPDLSSREHAVAWLEAEHDNLRACFEHMASHGLSGHAIHLAQAMHAFLYISGYWDEALSMHERAVAAARDSGDGNGQAGALGALSHIQNLTGRLSAACVFAADAVAIYRDLANRLGEANSLIHLGIVRFRMGEFEGAMALAIEALDIYREQGDPRGVAYAMCQLGAAQHMCGDHSAATATHLEALARYRELDHPHGVSNTLSNLSIVQLWTGDYAGAAASRTEVLALERRLGLRRNQALSLHDLGRIEERTGRYAAAMVSLTEAVVIFRDLGEPIGLADALGTLALAQHRTGDVEAAFASLSEALGIMRNVGNRFGEARILCALGQVQHLSGDQEAAMHSLNESLTMCRDLGDQFGQARALNALGFVLFDCGRDPESLSHHREALRMARELCHPAQEALALEGTGRCLVRADAGADGIRRLRDALAICRRLGVPDADRIAGELAIATGDTE
jgi:tetratricopeptide (TPR) repeat protein/transcriptional regulator with XRE-family HTH domain